jgi:pimeloyl-ACP methyl ester carboxylesterase
MSNKVAGGENGPRFVELPDGRRLAYTEYGDRHGKPVLYCHGYPSPRREAQLVSETAAALGGRIISPDRPGYGDSDPQRDRTISDWPADIARLADALGLERLALLGVSGGGPYAVACAWRLPERLSKIAIVCPLGPIYLPQILHDMNWAARANLTLARRAPALARLVFGRTAGGLLSRWPQSIDHFRSMAASDADRDTLQEPETRRVLNQTMLDAVRDGEDRRARYI